MGYRLLRMADEIEGIKTERGAVKVTLPGPDLFSQIDEAAGSPMRKVITAAQEIAEAVNESPQPRQRCYSRVSCKMKDDIIVAAPVMKVGRATGYCQRSDIERTLKRLNPDSSREDIREAVNAAVAELGLMCVTHNSYRYYRICDRKRLLDLATEIMNRNLSSDNHGTT